MARHPYGAIAERSRKQLGLISRTQAFEIGVTERQLSRMANTGVLERAQPSVWRMAAAPITWEQQLLAGLLGLGPAAVVSHHAAAALWELDGIRSSPVEFTVPRGHRNRLAVGSVHSSYLLDGVDLTRHGRFPLTTVARTIVDIADRTPRRRLEGIVDGACRDRLTDEAELLERLEALRRPGRRRLLAVLGADVGSGRPHTWLEREALQLFRSAGREPRMQTELTGSGSVARVDAFFDDELVVVEVAGHRTHSTRRQRQADNERRLRLEQAGYRVLEFTYEDVTERPDYVVATVLARLAVPH